MLLKVAGEDVHLPDFMVVGAPKTGTTSLYDYLFRNGIITNTQKEPNYLVYKDLGDKFKMDGGHEVKVGFLTDISKYIELYNQGTQGILRGDFSTHYLRYATLFVSNIKQLYGEDHYQKVKIIIMLRDPIKRAFSQYSHNVREQRESLCFTEAISPEVINSRMKDNYFPFYDYIRFSKYNDDINILKEHFPELLILKFEDFVTEPEKSLKEISSFLGVEIKKIDELRKVNISGKVSDNKFKKLLYNIFYHKNSFKKAIPISIKRKIKGRYKDRVNAIVLEKNTISSDEKTYARELLKNEYDHLKYYS